MPNSDKVMRGGAEVKFEPLKNKAAIEFLKRKVPEVSKHWDDFIAPVHAHSFTIAGAPTIEFLADMQNALVKAIDQGTSLGTFRKDFDATVKKFGWPYNGERGWRTRVIYQTNMRSAAQAAKWQVIQKNKDIAPYLEYIHNPNRNPRQQHLAWDGLILHVDDAFWLRAYPINAFGCHCSVRQHSAASLKRMGKEVSDSYSFKTHDVVNKATGQVYHNLPVGVDPGFDDNVGISWTAPATSFGRKLANLPDLLVATAYKNMVTDSFMQAVDRQFAAYFDDISARYAIQKASKQSPKSPPIFTGYLAYPIVDELNKFGIHLDNLAIITPYNQIPHLSAETRNKKLSPAYAGDWVKRIPSLIHNAQAVLYDESKGSLQIIPKEKVGSRRIKVIVKLIGGKDKAIVNQTTSISIVDEANLKEPHLKLIYGSL